MTMSNALRERLILQARTVIPRNNWESIDTMLDNAYIYMNEGIHEVLMYDPGVEQPGLIFDALTGSFLAPCGLDYIKEVISSGEKI